MLYINKITLYINPLENWVDDILLYDLIYNISTIKWVIQIKPLIELYQNKDII